MAQYGKYPWKSIYGGDGMQTEIDSEIMRRLYRFSVWKLCKK